MKKGYLVLQDGQVFEGFRFGGPADAVGELVFQLCWTDRDADLSSDRQLWDHSGGF